MLDDVSALVGSHGGRSNRVAFIDAPAEVDGLCLRIVVVSELAFDAFHTDIIYTVLAEHHAGDLRTCHPV